MLTTTKLYDKFLTVIPIEIRKELGINKKNKDYIIEWDIDENKQVKLNFRKRSKLNDIVGMIETEEPTNAVELKKKYQKGEKIDIN